jgi:peptidoglycan/xylan/chitin deacetylase (PgdA/CDA1 family)
MNGALCISLDFEKFWGVHDLKKISECEKFSKVDEVVERTLELFEKYDIHCTWAIVGLLNFDNLESLETMVNGKNVSYRKDSYSPYPINKFDLEVFDESLYLAKNTIDKIKNSRHQEIASHTFSHFYCLEEGIKKSDFIDDLNDFKSVFNSETSSIVFPRNQVNSEYLKLISEFGYKAYRGNQENKFWKNSSFENESLFKQTGRFIDAYLKITSNNLTEWQNIKTNHGLINIPASRFLRPYAYNKTVERLKINRIKNQMLKAAKTNQIYHLWWHPHNFTTNIDLNFSQLEQILIFQKELESKFNFKSFNMADITKKVEK